MTEIYSTSSRFVKSTKMSGRWLLYLLLGLVGNAGMWSLALFYLKVTPPIYASNWTLSLPGTVINARITLPNTGTASAEGISPYANTTQDPRENYKVIASSEVVQKTAATQARISPKEFGKPRIKIVNNTTLISFQFTGKSPEDAQKKSLAFYKAFQARLNELRTEEIAQRETKFQGKLREAQKKVKNSQRRLADYQFRSGFASNVQIEQLSDQIEQLRRQKSEIIAQQQQSNARLKQISTNLNLSALQATDALILKADQLFQQHLKDYTEVNAKLVLLNSKYLPNHPAVLREQSQLNSVKTALLTRSQVLLRRPVDPATLEQINMDQSGSVQENFLKEMVTSQVDHQGYTASAQTIDRQIAQLETKLKTLTESASVVEALRRDMQIEEAVFSSTLASLDIRNTDVLGSYPEVQLIEEPSFSDEPIAPKKKLVLLGPSAGTFFSITVLFLLGLRERQKKQINRKVGDTKALIR